MKTIFTLGSRPDLTVPSSAQVIHPAAFQRQSANSGTQHMNGTGRSQAQGTRPAAANDPLAGMTPKRIFIDCIWISKEPATNKLLLLCISRYFKPNATSSSLSYPQIAADCGFSERTSIRAAQDVRDRWLRIGIQQGHKTASGQKNLYVGAPPAELVEELRQRKMKGDVIEPDEAIVAAAEGMTPRHPLPEEGMTPCHPSDQRGDTVSERGDTDDTLILNKQEKKKERGGADAPAGATLPFEEADRLPLPSEGRSPSTRRGGGGKESKKAPPPEVMKAFKLYVELAERHDLPIPKPTPGIIWPLAAVLKDFDGLDGWRRVLAKIETNPALRGIGDGFSMKVSLWWLTTNGGENTNKVLSGACDDWGRRRSPSSSSGGGVF